MTLKISDSGNNGRGAVGFALLAVKYILVLKTANNYVTAPEVQILGRGCLLDGGRPARASAEMSPDPAGKGQFVSGIVLEDPGLGYICIPEVVIDAHEANCSAMAVLTVDSVQASSTHPFNHQISRHAISQMILGRIFLKRDEVKIRWRGRAA